ncbi:bacterial regulatory s, gntR family protein [Mycolicibacterium hassiacum DSM 44199]|uniref:Bacterial regulatory s, gntR family protein n=1 Tax=Mycolicibacterium hassiacum (strain DSM 44199 / CIP 105218 / JCM 12690 / 3849) TaxID=1122247 RepID=K5BE37_MYCHD|nr:PLP-dependent aminotransferase family protein [Mycolicibacterium hassiacum]EKF21951.1 bacterial regulatory s, gntR family protein [Mycolicibacterium hassiacum DSM 44199]MDA4085351.1 GntR family transcriptional regulator [Mycolicibacterium hassiacum DSM 44199]VCT92779.1 HTH-type transcriptional regulatory protein GabR [Mycolicibacterium hassiacum DSM 44199]
MPEPDDRLAHSRDLHLDLRAAITPGARGVRELLLTALRDAVRSGRLPPGTLLPPSRALAADLGIARNTVAEAYTELVAEGWLASRQGAGTWVVNTAGAQAPPRPQGRPVTPIHNLMPGSPDVAEFPRTEWAAATRRALASAPTEAFRMTDPRGRPELRAALTEYLARARGVRASPDSIVICAGVRHAVELLGRVFRGPLAVEAYGLHIFRDALSALDVPTVPIGVDGDGAVVAELDGLAVPAVLLTPAHHNPFGMALHPARRTAVVEWAARTGGYVFDDDYDGEFRYDRQPVGALQALAPERVVYLGSASKSLSPALRLGWMVLPTDLVDPVIAAAGGNQYYVDAVTQLTMAEFITSGRYDRHIRRMRMRYRRRRDRLVQVLSGFTVGVDGLAAGLSLTVTLPDGAEQEVLRRAGEAGIAVEGLSILRHPAAGADVPRPDGVVIGFGTPAEHAFGPALDALCAVLTASGLAR